VTPVGTNWVVTTLAGRFDYYSFQNGTGPNAWFNLPASVAVDSTGNVYVADTLNHLIRKVTPAGVVTTLAGWTERGSPRGFTLLPAWPWTARTTPMSRTPHALVEIEVHENFCKSGLPFLG
jgi:hypothetical protein